MSKEKEPNESTQTARPVRPLSTICERDGKIVLTLEMPGVAKNDVDVRIENDELRVSGRRTPVKSDGTLRMRERPRGDYYHSFTIDETIDRDSVSASMENGILTVSLALSEAVKPRKIEVKTGD